MEEKLIEYDEKADVLYLWYEHPAEVEEDTVAEDIGDGVLLRKKKGSGEVFGVTIMHLSKQDSVEGFKIPATV